jgi:hypothetical protein
MFCSICFHFSSAFTETTQKIKKNISFCQTLPVMPYETLIPAARSAKDPGELPPESDSTTLNPTVHIDALNSSPFLLSCLCSVKYHSHHIEMDEVLIGLNGL